MRQHPIAFLRYIYKKFWLLAIPFLRTLTHTESRELILKNSIYMDIFVLAIIVIIAVIRWYNTLILTNEKGITIKSGVLAKKEIFIPFSAVSMVKTGEIFLVKPFKAIMICIFTSAETGRKEGKKADCRLLLKLTNYKQICNKLPHNILKEKTIFRQSGSRLLLFSFAFSSILSGAIYFLFMLVQSGGTVKNELERLFVSAVNDVTIIAEKVIVDMSPFTAAVIVVIMVSWIISFSLNYFRNVNFVSTRDEKKLMTRNGYFNIVKNYADIRKLSFIDIRQNLMMKLFGVVQAAASCSGKMITIIPFCSKKKISDFFGMLIPEFCIKKEKFQSGEKQLFRYIAVPLVMMYGVITAGTLSVMLYPDWYRLIFFLSVISEMLILHFCAVRIVSYFTDGVVYTDELLLIKYSRFLDFHQIIIPFERIAEVKIKSSLFQKISSSCDIIIYAAGKKFSGHKVKGIKIHDAEKIILKVIKENYYETQK